MTANLDAMVVIATQSPTSALLDDVDGVNVNVREVSEWNMVLLA
jgi:hypothetical protein